MTQKKNSTQKLMTEMRRRISKGLKKLFEEQDGQTQQSVQKSGYVYVLNSPILTDYGTYEYEELSEEEATQKLQSAEVRSAVGHQGTADAITAITGVQVPMNRQAIVMKTGEEAIVVKVNGRLPEGKILSAEELRSLGFKFGLLRKVG